LGILPGTLIIGVGAAVRSLKRAASMRDTAVLESHLSAVSR
jgi:hypothetical protein